MKALGCCPFSTEMLNKQKSTKVQYLPVRGLKKMTLIHSNSKLIETSKCQTEMNQLQVINEFQQAKKKKADEIPPELINFFSCPPNRRLQITNKFREWPCDPMPIPPSHPQRITKPRGAINNELTSPTSGYIQVCAINDKSFKCQNHENQVITRRPSSTPWPEASHFASASLGRCLPRPQTDSF